jgi:hypothetical protein
MRAFTAAGNAAQAACIPRKCVLPPLGFACSERADRLALLVEHVGHDVDVGIAGRALSPALLVGRRIELAEAAAECQEIVVGEALAAEQQDAVVMPGLLDLGKVPIAQRHEIHVADLGPDGRREWRDGHRHVSPPTLRGQCFVLR